MERTKDHNSRARSIKTRIETLSLQGKKHQNPIREQDPLKQGLKHMMIFDHIKKSGIREQDPLKQGLKLNRFFILFRFLQIREQDPLKQGLKHD